MNIIFSYDFLKLEFKDIYQDIEELKKETTDDGIEGNINILIATQVPVAGSYWYFSAGSSSLKSIPHSSS